MVYQSWRGERHSPTLLELREALGGMPFEALTSPTLLSQGERREKEKTRVLLCFFLFPSLPLGERG